MKSALTFLTLVSLPCAFARELSADRPDATESPITVEPGRFQIESTLWGFSINDSVTTWTLGEANLKTGLTANSDLQLVLRPWIHEEGGGSGFGDIDVRFKTNLWGNDSGKTAAALMPFVTIPTDTAVSTGEWEGGLILPVSIEINEHLGLGFQVEVDRIWNEDDRNHAWDLSHTMVLGWSCSEAIGCFIEYAGAAGDHAYEATLAGGVTCATSEDVQWDLAVGFGLTGEADDFSLIQGITYRF